MTIRKLKNNVFKSILEYNNEIKLAFSSFKVGSMFSVKDPVPLDLRSRVVYKFLCAGCNACYIGETSRHLSTRVREHLSRDRNSHVYQHLQQSQACRCLGNKNAKISAVRSLADICFLHVLIWLITCIILSVCVSVFLVLSILHTVI